MIDKEDEVSTFYDGTRWQTHALKDKVAPPSLTVEESQWKTFKGQLVPASNRVYFRKEIPYTGISFSAVGDLYTTDYSMAVLMPELATMLGLPAVVRVTCEVVTPNAGLNPGLADSLTIDVSSILTHAIALPLSRVFSTPFVSKFIGWFGGNVARVLPTTYLRFTYRAHWAVYPSDGAPAHVRANVTVIPVSNVLEGLQTGFESHSDYIEWGVEEEVAQMREKIQEKWETPDVPFEFLEIC